MAGQSRKRALRLDTVVGEKQRDGKGGDQGGHIGTKKSSRQRSILSFFPSSALGLTFSRDWPLSLDMEGLETASLGSGTRPLVTRRYLGRASGRRTEEPFCPGFGWRPAKASRRQSTTESPRVRCQRPGHMRWWGRDMRPLGTPTPSRRSLEEVRFCSGFSLSGVVQCSSSVKRRAGHSRAKSAILGRC